MICEHAKTDGSPCDGGRFSLRVECPVFGVRCLKNCNLQCPEYSPRPTDSELGQIINLTIFNRGVGTELARIFSWLGYQPSSDCNCNENKNTYNELGVHWCEQNIEQIVDQLYATAQEKNYAIWMPFKKDVLRILVRRAIRNAKKK